MNYIFNFWNNLIEIVSILTSIFIAVYVYKLSKQLSIKEKYEHEIEITNKLKNLKIYQSVILADAEKYNQLEQKNINKEYSKQGGELYTIIPNYGVQFILRPENEGVPVGLVPFEWIKYIRDYDSEDSKTIIVCKFKGVKWYKDYKSPFKDINYIYKNPDYKKSDPDFMRFTTLKTEDSR